MDSAVLLLIVVIIIAFCLAMYAKFAHTAAPKIGAGYPADDVKLLRGGGSKQIVMMTYNVFSGSGEIGSENRMEHAINEIIKYEPDIICLQEATSIFIDELLKKANEFTAVRKLSILESDDAIEKAEESGYIAILSRYPIDAVKWIYKGGYHDDGIMRIDVVANKEPISIYNVHLSGGTFGKPVQEILEKRIRRMLELDLLNHDVRSNTHKSIFIAGDFNSDANFSGTSESFPNRPYGYNEHDFPETLFYPSKQIERVIDVWSSLKGDDKGYTEDTESNLFRKFLKPKQHRRTRYDQIYFKGKHIEPISVRLIGTESCGVIMRDDNQVTLYPSDHYGVCAVFRYN